MFFTACFPSRSESCARYRLEGSTEKKEGTDKEQLFTEHSNRFHGYTSGQKFTLQLIAILAALFKSG
jgi:hypothetical protein